MSVFVTSMLFWLVTFLLDVTHVSPKKNVSLHMLYSPSSEHVIKKLPTLLCTVIFPGTVHNGYLFYITLDYIFVHDIFCKSIANEADFGGHVV